MKFTYQELSKIEYRYRKNLFSEPYIHHAIELFYLTKNTMTANINGEEYEMVPGDLITVFPNVVHSYYKANKAEGYLLIVPMEYLKPFSSILTTKMPESPVLSIGLKPNTAEGDESGAVNTSGESAEPNVPEGHGEITASEFNGQMILSLFELLEKDFSFSGQHPGYAVSPYTADSSHPYMVSFARLIVGKVLSLYRFRDENVNLGDQVRRVIQYVHEHFKEGPSRSDIAHALGLNPSYVSRIFSTNLQTPLTEYIHSIQLENAALLLRETTLPIAQIANECGFNSIRSFNRIFAEKFRTTPRDYRK